MILKQCLTQVTTQLGQQLAAQGSLWLNFDPLDEKIISVGDPPSFGMEDSTHNQS